MHEPSARPSAPPLDLTVFRRYAWFRQLEADGRWRVSDAEGPFEDAEQEQAIRDAMWSERRRHFFLRIAVPDERDDSADADAASLRVVYFHPTPAADPAMPAQSGGGVADTSAHRTMLPSMQSLLAAAHWGRGMRGLPGCAHGGAVASLMDHALGLLLRRAGLSPVATVRLTVNFRRFVAIDTVTLLESHVDRMDGRKILCSCALYGSADGGYPPARSSQDDATAADGDNGDADGAADGPQGSRAPADVVLADATALFLRLRSSL